MWSLWTALVALALAGDLDEPLVTGMSSPEDAAVVVGISAYPTGDPVPGAVADAERFAAWLTASRGIPEDRVTLLTDVDADAIVAALEAMPDGGTRWFFFAGRRTPAALLTTKGIVGPAVTRPLLDGVLVFEDAADRELVDGHGAYTTALLHALRGQADLDGDGTVTLGELSGIVAAPEGPEDEVLVAGTLETPDAGEDREAYLAELARLRESHGGTPGQDPVVTAILGVQTGDWDAAIQEILVASFDEDGSGMLDTESEVGAIPCGAWLALDAAVRETWNEGLRATYGFVEDRPTYLGDALGVSPEVRGVAGSALEDCADTPSIAPRPSTDPEASWPDPWTEGDVAAYIGALPRPGSDTWDAYVGMALVASHDADGSGLVDSREEVAGIPCRTWRAAEKGALLAYGGDLRQVYGLGPETPWAAGRLGLSIKVRGLAGLIAQRCQGSGVDVAAAILSVPGAGGPAWDVQVKDLLLHEYDIDRSGGITKREVDRVDCEVWLTADIIAVQAFGTPFRDLYGFARGRTWLGGTLGFERSARDAVHAATLRCEATADRGPRLDQAILRIPDPASDQWDEAVGELLLESYDADGSGQIDTREELDRIACPVWAAMDASVRTAGFRTGLGVTYGFAPESQWVGALPIAQSLREPTWRGIQGCLGAGLGPIEVPTPGPASPEVDEAAEPASGESPTLVAAIATLPDPTSTPWDAEVSRLLIDAHDADESGVLDTPEEVAEIHCSTWQTLEQSVQGSVYASPLAGIYGFEPGMLWVGDKLGFDETVRAEALASLTGCLE